MSAEESSRGIHGADASLFWVAGERQQEGEHPYQAYVKVTYNCGKCGVNLPEGARTRIRCARGHLNDITQIGTHVRDVS